MGGEGVGKKRGAYRWVEKLKHEPKKKIRPKKAHTYLQTYTRLKTALEGGRKGPEFGTQKKEGGCALPFAVAGAAFSAASRIGRVEGGTTPARMNAKTPKPREAKPDETQTHHLAQLGTRRQHGSSMC